MACPKCGKQSPSEWMLCADCSAKKNAEERSKKNEISDNNPFGSLDGIVALFSLIVSFIFCLTIEYKTLGFHSGRSTIIDSIGSIIIIIVAIIVYALCSKICCFIRKFLN